ncbi:MAG: hypothetical protein ACREI9_11460 [Nitrospiraceae bacterium]
MITIDDLAKSILSLQDRVNQISSSTKIKQFEDFFVYSWEATIPALSASVPISVTILADSNFYAVKGIGSIFANVAARTPVDFQDIVVTVNDSGSGRNLQDKPVSLRHFFGHPQEPLFFEPYKLFVANSTVSVTFSNLSNADAIVRASMVGYKAYR